ncbi:MAG: DUF1295 domain-containing protein [Candidatus Lokiarchaeota archaeon]|nr:DUF1295 domain-containing protein [Candidatus Lokiarchaeota archaeon]
MLIIILILIFLFLLNFLTYWILILKQKLLDSKLSEWYKKIFPVIWIICVYLIPIVNSSLFQPFFNENVSYFHQYWIWFIFIGIIIIVLGIKIHTLATKLLKTAINEGETPILIRKGVYEIVRHPQYLSWFLIYLGITFIFDSFIAVIISPILLILTELLCFLEEKYLLISKFKKKYDQYKKKTPYRLISPPYNYIFIIMGIIVVYIGFLNIVNI